MNPTLLLGLFCFGLGACGASQSNVAKSEAMDKTSAVSDRQLPVNQRFHNLDEYLGWLRLTQAPVDGAWYKQIRPGVYELQTGNRRILGSDGEAKQTFTREELERKFGFKS